MFAQQDATGKAILTYFLSVPSGVVKNPTLNEQMKVCVRGVLSLVQPADSVRSFSTLEVLF